MILRKQREIANQHAAALFVIGCMAVAAHNWRQWKRDKTLAERLRHRRPPVPQLRQHPKVSALVAAWNEAERIDNHIASFLALSYPNIELVICAGGGDHTLEQAQHYAGEKVIVLEQQPGEGKQRALARCLEHASGHIIYLTDADCLFNDEALARLLAPMLNENAQVVTGASRPLDQQLGQLLPSYIWSADVVVNAHTRCYVNGLLGRNAAIARPALAQSGGLTFVSPSGTDYQLAQRIRGSGFKIRFVRNSIVQTAYPATVNEYRRRQSRWLRNLLVYGPRYRALRDVVATLQTVIIGAIMLVLPFIATFLGRFALAIWGILFAHAVASKLRYALFTAFLYCQRISLMRLVASVPLAVLDFGIWVMPVFDVLFAKRRHRW